MHWHHNILGILQEVEDTSISQVYWHKLVCEIWTAFFALLWCWPVLWEKEISINFSSHTMYRQHQADSMLRCFGQKTWPLSSYMYNKSAFNLTSKFLYINTQYLGLISILGMTQSQPRWKSGTSSTRSIEGRQVSQAIVPKIHSQRERCSQGPNPLTLPYLAQTGVLAASLLDYHDGHVC